MSRIFILVLLLSLLAVSCNVRREKADAGTSPIENTNDFSLQQSAFSRQAIISNGTPLSIKGKKIHPDSLATPKIIPLTGELTVLPAHTNVHPASVPEITFAPSKLTTITPGKDGVGMRGIKMR